MTDDLSTRLLQAIEEREKIARAAAPGTWEYCEDDADGEIISEGPGYQSVAFARSGNASGWDAQNATGRHIAVNDPPSVLLLCSAHREIVELHLVCQADYALAAEKVATYAGIWPAEQAKLEEASTHALIRLGMSEHILSGIARGYGLKEGE